jgi:protein gp37
MSKIEWTDRTWNPVRGCSRVSEGCRNCYAERIAGRFSGPKQPFRTFAVMTGGGARWTGYVELIEAKLDQPLRWRKPSRVFVNSMSDLFHEGLSNEDIASVFGVMAEASQHTFQVLTKRPRRMLQWFEWVKSQGTSIAAELVKQGGGWPWARRQSAEAAVCSYHARFALEHVLWKFPIPIPPWPLPNVWLGVSVEDQATANRRVPLLLQTPAAKRLVSYEPALGPVNFRPWLFALTRDGNRAKHLDWIIVGGESGPGARVFDLAWARSTVAQCRGQGGVACFVKQLGSRIRIHRRGPDWDGPGPESDFKIVRTKGKGAVPRGWPAAFHVREFPA